MAEKLTNRLTFNEIDPATRELENDLEALYTILWQNCLDDIELLEKGEIDLDDFMDRCSLL